MKLPLSLTLAALLGASSIAPVAAQAASTTPREATFRLTSSHHHHHYHYHHSHLVRVWVRGHLVWHHGHKHWVSGHYEWRRVY